MIVISHIFLIKKNVGHSWIKIKHKIKRIYIQDKFMINLVRFFFACFLTLVFCFSAGCDGTHHASHTSGLSSVSFRVQWPDEKTITEDATNLSLTAAETMSDDCSSRGVSQVTVAVQNSSGSNLKSVTYNCSARQGTLSGIKPQSNCTIVVSGLNSSDEIIYQGRKTGVNLVAGANNAGTIQVERLTNQAPVAVITNPGDYSTYTSGQSITFTGTGTDAEDGDMLGSSFVWTSDLDGEVKSDRKSFDTSSLSVGTHTIILTVTDKNGNTGTDSISITINPYHPTDETYTNSIGMTFVYIEPGTFMMGSPEDELGRNRYETQHQVTLTKGYYMQITEVTQGQWETVMGSNPSYFDECGENCPVEQVSWENAQSFIEELNRMEASNGYSLPTEAQWEYAARAGSTTAFANGGITETKCNYDPNLDAMGWYCYNSDDKTHPVAQKGPNAWGLYDMHGNVWEWCLDWWGIYPEESVTNPEGPTSGSFRVQRGGSCIDPVGAHSCRSAYRSSYNPDSPNYSFGLRIVMSVDSFVTDDDGDGYNSKLDCNDNDNTIYPGAIEICGDGIDQDCDGGDEVCPLDPNDVDNDGDGYTENQGDCNDDDVDINPGEFEICGDGIDQDCDGGDEACATNQAPSALINSPSDGSKFESGETISFTGTGTDPEDGTLAASAFTWTSSIDGQIYSGSKNFNSNGLSAGPHTIILTVTDSNEATDTDSIQITVKAMPVGETFTNTIGMKFVSIPAGSFIMGSPDDELGRYSKETQHQVTLTKGYYIQTTEVTQGQWKALMNTVSRGNTDCRTDNCPVVLVSWNDAQSFIEKLNRIESTDAYRLPTEAEWEYACRAGSTSAFATGEATETECGYDANLDIIGWYCNNSNNDFHPVGQKQPNAWGLYDMHGNVGEWCYDWYDSYPSSAVTDPKGPAESQSGFWGRIYRGCCFDCDARDCRSASRGENSPSSIWSGLGFRLAKDL